MSQVVSHRINVDKNHSFVAAVTFGQLGGCSYDMHTGRRYNNILSVNLRKRKQNVKTKVVWELFQGPSQYIPRGI